MNRISIHKWYENIYAISYSVISIYRTFVTWNYDRLYVCASTNILVYVYIIIYYYDIIRLSHLIFQYYYNSIYYYKENIYNTSTYYLYNMIIGEKKTMTCAHACVQPARKFPINSCPRRKRTMMAVNKFL